MLEVVQISLVAKNEIAREGLRNILSSDNFRIEASVSDVSALLDPDGNIERDDDHHVIVIDSGPSRRYVEQLRAAIRRVTPLPPVLLLNTHHHPDHFLGNQALAIGMWYFQQREKFR